MSNSFENHISTTLDKTFKRIYQNVFDELLPSPTERSLKKIRDTIGDKKYYKNKILKIVFDVKKEKKHGIVKRS